MLEANNLLSGARRELSGVLQHNSDRKASLIWKLLKIWLIKAVDLLSAGKLLASPDCYNFLLYHYTTLPFSEASQTQTYLCRNQLQSFTVFSCLASPSPVSFSLFLDREIFSICRGDRGLAQIISANLLSIMIMRQEELSSIYALFGAQNRGRGSFEFEHVA